MEESTLARKVYERRKAKFQEVVNLASDWLLREIDKATNEGDFRPLKITYEVGNNCLKNNSNDEKFELKVKIEKEKSVKFLTALKSKMETNY